MSLKKFAVFEVISAVLVPHDATTATLRTIGHRAVFEYDPRPGYLYVRSRAISSRCNDNFDEFPAGEIKDAYQTFIGKPVFVNHHNENHRRMRGVCIDAALHEDRNPDGSPDTWAEVLMEVDAVRFPKLAQAILKKHIDRTSMGTDVAYSICSACNNRASTPSEYCEHIPRMKGKRLYKAGGKEGVLIREICYGLGFFENSLLVEEPADPTAYFLGVDERGMHTATKASPSTNESVAKPEDLREHLDGVALAQDGKGGYYVRTHRARSDSYPDPHEIPDHDIEFIRSTGTTPKQASLEAVIKEGSEDETHFSVPLSNDDRDFYQQMREQGEQGADLHHTTDKRVVNLEDPADLQSHLMTTHGWDTNDLWRNSHPEDHPGMMATTDLDRPLSHAETRAAHDHEHDVLYPDDYPHAITMGDEHFHASAPKISSVHPAQDLQSEASVKTLESMTPAELATHRASEAAADQWHVDHPVHADNVMKHWTKATPDEQEAGRNWYADAHHLAKHVARDTKTSMSTMAGLVSAYSPQTHWAANIMTAARVARTKIALGGKGEGVLATKGQKKVAQRLLDGEHYDTALGGPKTHAFAHLIEHGGNADPEHPKVVVDRHALSVAAGARASDMAYARSGLSGKKRYQQVSDVYHEAARRISGETGIPHEAHQVQATTWLVRQRLNEQQDRALSATAGSRSASLARRAIKQWKEYAGEHHPSLLGKMPGTGYSRNVPEDVQHEIAMEKEHGVPDEPMDKSAMVRLAFGETKAPADVDTLRDEECPVCGETDSFDGNTCQVCGYDAPPQMFRDPDLEMAKSLDLRKDQMDDAGGLPGQDGLTPGQQDANGGIPGEVPGEQVPGSDATVDPSMLDEMGQVPVDQMGNPVVDPSQIGPDGLPLDPNVPVEVGPDGLPLDPSEDPNAVGPDGLPLDPNAVEPQQIDPNQIGPDGQPLDPSQVAPDGQQATERGEGDPGTPEDGVADLQCPVCGFEADAQQPTSVNMDEQAIDGGDSGDGTLAGDVCPNCGKGQMISVGEMEQMQQQQAGVPVQ